METREDKAIKIRYIFPDNYNATIATGALGGPMPDGHHIVAHFYLERASLPYSQTFLLGEDGKLGDEVAAIPEDCHKTVIRFINSGVILTRDMAETIGNWLLEQAKQLPEQELSKPSKSEAK